jgi:mono/diheme cytochrome c family protein
MAGSTCQVCHGANGAGNRAADGFFEVKVPRLNSAYVQAKSDADLRKIILEGSRRMDPVRFQESDGARHGLPAYAVDPVIAFVRSLGDKH